MPSAISLIQLFEASTPSVAEVAVFVAKSAIIFCEPLALIVTLKFDIFLIIISLPLIVLVIAGKVIVPVAALVYITYLSSVADTV